MTKDTDKNKGTLSDADILRQIEAFGADKARWKIPATSAALKDTTTATALREAEALDRLLAMAAPKKTVASDALLIDRIVAAAEKTPRVVVGKSQTATNVPQAVASSVERSNVVTFERRTAFGRVFGSDLRRGFAVLAASLVLGLSIGQSGLMDRAVVGIEEITGVAIAPVSQEISRALTLDTSVEDL